MITSGLDSTPSGMIEKPEGRIWMLLGSCPAITSCVVFISTGAYTTTDSYELVQLSCSTHMLFSLDFTVWNWGGQDLNLESRLWRPRDVEKINIPGWTQSCLCLVPWISLQ